MKQTNRGQFQEPERHPKPFRCHCGSMLARLVPQGVELKCRRCKRQVIVPLTDDVAAKWESEM